MLFVQDQRGWHRNTAGVPQGVQSVFGRKSSQSAPSVVRRVSAVRRSERTSDSRFAGFEAQRRQNGCHSLRERATPSSSSRRTLSICWSASMTSDAARRQVRRAVCHCLNRFVQTEAKRGLSRHPCGHCSSPCVLYLLCRLLANLSHVDEISCKHGKPKEDYNDLFSAPQHLPV